MELNLVGVVLSKDKRFNTMKKLLTLASFIFVLIVAVVSKSFAQERVVIRPARSIVQVNHVRCAPHRHRIHTRVVMAPRVRVVHRHRVIRAGRV